MEIKKDYGFNELKDRCWSGAIDTLNKIEKNNKEDNLMNLLKETFNEEIPTLTQVNDFLWFEDDFIFNELNINED